MRVRQSDAVRISVYILISAISFIIVYIINGALEYELWITWIAVMTMLHAVLSVAVLLGAGEKIYRLPVLFLLCLYLFNWGQVWLLGVFKSYDFYKSWNKITIYPEEIYKFTCFAVLVVTACYTLGALLRMAFSRSAADFDGAAGANTPEAVKTAGNEAKKCINFGYLVLMLTLPFNLYENALYMLASFSSGYKAIFDLDVSNYVHIIGWMSVIGFVLLLSGYDENKKERVLIVSIILYGAEMLSGNRGPSICALLAILSFYFALPNRKKVNVSRLLLLLIAGFAAMVFLATLKTFRGYSVKTVETFFSCVQYILTRNILLQNLEEFGGTVAVTSITKIYLNSTGNYLHGWTYISGLFSIFPNIGGVINEINRSGGLVQIVREYGIAGRYQSIGGSFVAELLLNFQYLWWLAAIIWGAVFEWVGNKIEKCIGSYRVAYWTMPVFSLLLWVRSNYNSIVRIIVWAWLLVFIINGLVKARSNERQQNHF